MIGHDKLHCIILIYNFHYKKGDGVLPQKGENYA